MPLDLEWTYRWDRQLSVDLWLPVVLVSITDIVVTVHGLHLGLVEVNPIARASLVLFGAWSLLVLKGIALGIGAVNCRVLKRRGYLVPATFILVWGSAVLANLALILTHAY